MTAQIRECGRYSGRMMVRVTTELVTEVVLLVTTTSYAKLPKERFVVFTGKVAAVAPGMFVKAPPVPPSVCHW